MGPNPPAEEPGVSRGTGPQWPVHLPLHIKYLEREGLSLTPHHSPVFMTVPWNSPPLPRFGHREGASLPDPVQGQ